MATEKADSKVAGNTIDKKTAGADFDRFALAWEIDTDVAEMSPDDGKSFEEQKRKIIKGIMIGRASVDDNGDIEYRFKDPVHGLDSVTLRMPKGEGYMEMDRYKEQQGIHKFMAVMGHMTGKQVRVFSGMSGIDLKFCMAVSALFLAS